MARPRLKKSIRAAKLRIPSGPGERPTRIHGLPLLRVARKRVRASTTVTAMTDRVEGRMSVVMEAKRAAGFGRGMLNTLAVVVVFMVTTASGVW